MIRTEFELDQAMASLLQMHRALAALRADVLPRSARQFALMAEGPLAEIRRLQEEIDEYSGAADAESETADLWMRIVGARISWPAAPISILTAFLDGFRKGVQAVAAYDLRGTVQGGRRPGALQKACDFEMIALRAGSLRVGVRLPDFAQPALPGLDLTTVRTAFDSFVRAATWADSEENADALESAISSSERRRVVLNAVKTFLPRPRGDVDCLEISGRSIPNRRTIRLTGETHSKIDQAIDRTLREQVESRIGELREIDLDNKSFILRNVEPEGLDLPCKFEDDLIETAKQALDRRVSVTGVRRERRLGYHPLRVSRLEVLEDEGEEV